MVVLGDVTGKGMGASLLMSSFLASARVLYDVCDDVRDLANRLGRLVHASTDSGRFITGFVGRLDPATGTLEYVNAGHPAPCLLLGDQLRELESTGVPFGILPDFRYASASVQLRPAELLAIFSDGVPEAQHGEEFFDDVVIPDDERIGDVDQGWTVARTMLVLPIPGTPSSSA